MSLHFGVRSTMSNSEITNTQATANTPERQVIAIKGPVHHWIEPWYLAYAILAALLVAFGLFQGIWPLLSVASNDLAAELAPIGEGTAMGLFNASAAAASALGAITGGAVADRFGYESVNVFAAAGALLSLLCVLPLRNARRQVKNSQTRTEFVSLS